MKHLFRLLLLSVTALAAFNLCAESKRELLPYLMTGITEYSGENPFRTQSVGLMTVLREQEANGGDWNYTISYKTVLTAGNNQGSVEFKPGPLMVSCGPDRRRMVGGMDFLREFGMLSNNAMDKVGRPDYTGSRRVKVPMNLSEFLPASPTFKVTYKSATSKTLGPCLIVSAVSDMFSCKIPDSDGFLTGTYRVLIIADPQMNDLYFRFCSFNSSHNSEKMNTTDQFWITDSDAKPVDMADLIPIIESMGKTFPSSLEKFPDSAGVPPQPWIVHAMTVRKYMDTIAGAAIEGKPNFIELATVGSILAIDAVISLGNKMVAYGVERATGYQLPVWGGIPSFVGDKLGWAAAAGVNAATGKNTANVDNWRTTGGDLASLAMIPFAFTNPGKAMDAFQLINKLPAGAAAATNVILQINRGGKIIQMTELQGKIINVLDGAKAIYEAVNNQIKIWNPQATAGGAAPGGGPTGSSPPGGGQYVGGIKSSSVAGGFSFVPGNYPAISTAIYNPRDNSCLINNQFTYRIPVEPSAFKYICQSVANNHGFGYSLAGSVREHYSALDNIGMALNISDRFLGSVVFGNADGIPAGCSPAASYRSHPDALQQAFPYCFNVNFVYRFDIGKDKMLYADGTAQIGFVQAEPEKARQGIWEPDDVAQKSGNIPAGLEANGRHLAEEWQYYAKTPPVSAVMRYGESAAFCLMLQKNGINLNNFVR